MKRRKSILQIAACTLSILLITEEISGMPAIAFAADKDLLGETVIEADAYEAVIEADDEETVISCEAAGDDAVVSDINEDASKRDFDSALPEGDGDHVEGANTVIDKIGTEGYDDVTPDGMELYTAFEADLNLEIQGGRYFKGHEIINFGAGNSGSSVVFALDEIPVEMSDNYMLFVDYYDYSSNPDGDLVYYLEKVTGTALYAWEYEKQQADGTYKRVRSVPISAGDFTINDDDDTMYVNLGLGHIDEAKRSFGDLQNLGTYTAPKIYSYLSDHPGMKKDHYQHVPTLSGLVRLNGQAFKNPSKNPIAIAAMCYDATATAEEDLYKTASTESTGGYTYHEYSWDNNAGFVATQSISYDCYYYGGDDNYTKYWSDEPYYASKMGSFSLRPYVYRFTDTGTEHILTLYHVTPYSLFVRKTEQGRHVFDNWKAAYDSRENLPIDTWKIPATYTDPLSGITYKVRIAKGGNIVPHYASKLVIEDGVGFPDDCSYLFSSAARINVNLRCLSEIVIEGNAKTVGSNIKNMSYMFLGKQGRQGFDATTYSSLDFAALDTSSVTDMSFMFADVTMTNRANIDVTTLDTSKVTDFKGMFRSYHVPGTFLSQPATALDLSHFNTESAEDMSEMFEGSSVSALDLSGFDFSKVTDMSRMFTFTEYLESITFPAGMDSSKVTDMSFMFAGDYNLTQINNITAMDTGSVTDMSGMFGAHKCRIKNYETIPVDLDPEVWSGSYQYDKKINGFAVFNPAWVTAELFNVNDGPAITSLDLTGFDTRKVKYANGMFYMPGLTEIKWGTNTTFEALSDAGGMFTLASVKKLDLTGRKFSNIKFACSDRFPIEMFNLNKATELVLGEDSINLSNLSSKGQLMINAPMLYSLDFRHVEMGSNALAGEGALYYGSPGSLQGASGLYEIYLPAGMPVLTSPAELPGTFYDDDGAEYTIIYGGYENDLHLVNPEAEVTEEDKVPVNAIVLNKTEASLYPNETLKLSATISPANATDKSVRWSSSDMDKAKVDDTGTVIAVAEGTATITATANGAASGTTIEAECIVTVLPSEIIETGGDEQPINPSAGGVTVTDEESGEANIWVAGLNNSGYYYTGDAIKPEIHVYKGYKILKAGTDYTLEYKNNKNVSAGVTSNSKKPQIIIGMKGSYSGSKTVYFKINPMPLTELTVSDGSSVSDHVILNAAYKAKKKNRLKPTLMYNGAMVKYGKKDVTFKWYTTDNEGMATETESNCIEPGIYAVKIYAGSNANLSDPGNTGRQVATIKVDGKPLISSVKISGFKRKLAYNSGLDVVQPSTVRLTYRDKSGTYTLNEWNKAKNTGDYTVTYKNNHEPGTATVIYEAVRNENDEYNGKFQGRIVKTYKITGKSVLREAADHNNLKVGECKIVLGTETDGDKYVFTNAQIKPSVTVTAKIINNEDVEEEITLRPGKDYTVTYKNNKAVAANNATKKNKDAAPQLIIKGKGNYAFGTAKNAGIVKRFSIVPVDLNDLILTISDRIYSSKANDFKKTGILITDKDYRDLKLKAGAGKDYTVTYETSDGSSAPIADQVVTVTIRGNNNDSLTGTGSCKGEVKGSYRIIDKKKHTDINKAKVVVNPNSNGKAQACIYTGSGIEPGQAGQPVLKLTYVSGKSKVTLNEKTADNPSGDYEILGYFNNVNKGNSAVILIRGTGDTFRGVRAVKFRIAARGVSSRWGGVYDR